MNKQAYDDDLFDQITDDLIRASLEELDEQEAKEFLEMPPEQRKEFQINGMARRRGKKTIRRELCHTCRTIKKALVIAAVLALLAVLATNVGAIKSFWGNFFLNIKSSYTTISNDLPDQSDTVYIDRRKTALPAFVPDELREQPVYNFANFVQVDYFCGNTLQVSFASYTLNVGITLDSENADRIEKITVNGADGLLIEKGGEITITWQTDRAFLLVGSESDETMMRMAESVGIINE